MKKADSANPYGSVELLHNSADPIHYWQVNITKLDPAEAVCYQAQLYITCHR